MADGGHSLPRELIVEVRGHAGSLYEAIGKFAVIARPVPFEIEPSVTVTEVEPALTKTMAPFLPEETVATPSVKPIAVAVAKLVAVPEELVTVAWAPEGLSATGPKVRLWEPA